VIRPRGTPPHPHDRALAQLLLDLGDGQAEGLLALGIQLGGGGVWGSHEISLEVKVWPILLHNDTFKQPNTENSPKQ